MWAVGIKQDHSSSCHCDLKNLQDDKAQRLQGKILVYSFVGIWTYRAAEMESDSEGERKRGVYH